MDPNTSDMNVKVAVRCRPLNEEEEKKGMNPVVACDTEKSSIKVSYGSGIKKTTKSYNFDRVFGRYASQEEIFKRTASGIIDEVLAGFSCTVFAYGQTGTGKTYTMEGDLNDPKKIRYYPS